MKASLALTLPVCLMIVGTSYADSHMPPPGNMPPPPMPMNMPMDGPMHHPDMQRPRFNPPPRPQRPQPPELPSWDELARIAPPAPMTADKIKEMFAKRREKMSEMLEMDRNAAQKYAEDFARLQKYEADYLDKIMERAEKRRQQMLERLDTSEKVALERFEERQKAEKGPETK